jgi:coenzyme F420-reducing hydrogenase alpha subunit
MPDLIDNTQTTPSPGEASANPDEMTMMAVGENPADDSGDASTEAAGGGSSGSSSGTSGGTARGIDERAIEKWTAEQQKVFNSVKDKVQELGIAKDDVERIAAYSVLKFIQEKDRKPDTRVDRVQAVNANGDTIVRMENMKYGDREPIFTNDVRLKDTPAFDHSAAQIEQANQRINTKSAAEQNIANHHQNQDTNQREKPNVMQKTEDQVMARVQSSFPAITR